MASSSKQARQAVQLQNMQTLLQLLPAEVESPTVTKVVEWKVPEVSIVDEPRFGYRGKHFDPLSPPLDATRGCEATRHHVQ